MGVLGMARVTTFRLLGPILRCIAVFGAGDAGLNLLCKASRKCLQPPKT